MKTDRRRFLHTAGAFAALLALGARPARAAASELELQQPGTLRIAVYANFAPWSTAGKGIEVALGRALAEHLGLQPQVVEFPADENMNDDLRKVPETIRLSKQTYSVLWQNITLALGIKAVFFVLAVFGSATMWMAVFADMGASLLVVFNGLRLMRAKPVAPSA